MTADNQIEVTLTQNLDTGEVSVKANKALSFNIALRLYLIGLKGLKDNLINRVLTMDRESLVKLAFGEAYHESVMAQLPEDDEAFKEDVLLKMEGEMYDMLNLAVGNFLDTEFPRVNANPSLTEEAAEAAGLDRTATDEELVQAEVDFINQHPDLAAQCAELQPTEVRPIAE